MTTNQAERRCPDQVHMAEFVCKIIEPSCRIVGYVFGDFRIIWIPKDEDRVLETTRYCNTPQQAWREAFNILDRRKSGNDATMENQLAEANSEIRRLNVQIVSDSAKRHASDIENWNRRAEKFGVEDGE